MLGVNGNKYDNKIDHCTNSVLMQDIVSATPKHWKDAIKFHSPNLDFEIRNTKYQKAATQLYISKFVYLDLLNNLI